MTMNDEKNSFIHGHLERMSSGPAIDTDFVRALAGDCAMTASQREFLQEEKRSRGIKFYSDVMFILTQNNYPPAQARQLWLAILKHRNALNRALDRNVGITVACVDYLSNIKRSRRALKVIEETKLDAIAKLSTTDGLTGLQSRASFEVALTEEFNKYKRYGNQFTLMILDIDDFKTINDTYGHPYGDHVLTRVSHLINQHVRAVDIAARYGGEELAILLPQTNLIEAYQMADRLCDAVGKCHFQRRVTASIGVAACPQHGSSAETLVQAADKALYQAKREGKNQVRCASPLPVQQTFRQTGNTAQLFDYAG